VNAFFVGGITSSDYGQQQDLFGLFTPTAGVHRAPPAAVGVTAGLAAAGNFVPLPEKAPEQPEIVFERSLKARNYRLTLRRDGVAVATIPARGSQREAERFVAQQTEWLEQARARQRRRPRAAEVWPLGARVLWRGELRRSCAWRRSARSRRCAWRRMCFACRGSTAICGRRWRRSLRDGRRSNCRRARGNWRRRWAWK